MKLGGIPLKEVLFQRCDSALLGAFLFVVGSVVSKLSSFVLNIYLAKKVNHELFGIGFVSIALITNLSQFLNKKCFRRVALSEPIGSVTEESLRRANIQSSINICWLSIVSTCFLSLILSIIWIANPPSSIILDHKLVRQFNISVILAGFSSIVESISEPLIFNLIRKEQVFLRSVIEILSGTSKSILLMFVVMFKSSNIDILYYSIGQLIHSLVFLSSTLIACFKTFGQTKEIIFLPKLLGSSSKSQFFLENHKNILKQQILVSIQSTVLQETDKILVLHLFSAKEWSDYGVISNLANIVTRVLFAPIEEISAERFKEVKLDTNHNKSLSRLQANLAPLRELLFFSTSIGFIAICFGPPISKSLVSILFGPKWAKPENIQLFSANIYTLGILSIHGILETFMLSLGANHQISAYRRFSIVMYCMHVTFVLIFRSGGCMALLISNGLVMLLQVFYYLSFIFGQISPPIPIQEPRKIFHSFLNLLVEKGSRRIYFTFLFGGLIQRCLIHQIRANPEPKKLIQSDLGELLLSSLILLCSLIISIPSIFQILKKSRTNKHK
ncbi:Rft protein family protein [Cryptosporidium meleagridis]|uniref:Protein RFT1 homolog n=1 Tax=Cryptosporidium meleagridis TaxID=93969 RepID=A0A2P4YYZ7_9CRYT|nr:Rft protein family protein [Cryptosporidium meleagridis]